jgi:hypothetical protein
MDLLNRLPAATLIADGLITLLCGHRFLRWQSRFAPDWYVPALDALLEIPEPVLRLAAFAEACLGAMWLARLGRGTENRLTSRR